MELSLTEPEADVLREVLDTALRDLRSEIPNTDNAHFKHDLRDRELVLRRLLEPFGGPLPDEPQAAATPSRLRRR